MLELAPWYTIAILNTNLPYCENLRDYDWFYTCIYSYSYINSSNCEYQPIVAEWRIYVSENEVTTGSDNCWMLFGAQLLYEPMLTYCPLCPWEQIVVNLEWKYRNFQSGKLIWRCLKNGSYFICTSTHQYHDDVIKWKLFALLALCVGNSPVAGEFPTQRPMTRSFDVFFDLCLNKRLKKQSWRWWFETPSRSLWRHSVYLAATTHVEWVYTVLMPCSLCPMWNTWSSHVCLQTQINSLAPGRCGGDFKSLTFKLKNRIVLAVKLPSCECHGTTLMRGPYLFR